MSYCKSQSGLTKNVISFVEVVTSSLQRHYPRLRRCRRRQVVDREQAEAQKCRRRAVLPVRVPDFDENFSCNATNDWPEKLIGL